MLIYLARHGQTDWNKAKRLQGWTDIDLNRTGRAQAALLRTRLEGEGIKQVYCSPLMRARNTAATLRGLAPIEYEPDLRERCMGAFEGRVLDGQDPELEHEFRSRKYKTGDALDGGESIGQFQRRVNGALDRIVKGGADGPLVIVGHGATNSMILGRFLQLDLDGNATLRVANDDLFRIETDDGHVGRVWHELIDPRRTRMSR
ncbi:MAG: histidine phosphatase family protein [Myxococcota bacterium]